MERVAVPFKYEMGINNIEPYQLDIVHILKIEDLDKRLSLIGFYDINSDC
ncbi:hypothetical protein [uncultured Shewanella sp.]|nr:hypothetical protein [uncultured Shewanella sp.]